MENKIIIKIYSGISVEDKCRHQLHPLNEVKRANEIVQLNKSIDLYSNSPDFISAIKYLTLENESEIECEFFLNGVSHGDSIEPIFADFNMAFRLLDELTEKEV